MTATKDRLSPFIATSATLHGLLFVAVVFAPVLFPAKHPESWGTNTLTGVKVGMAQSLPGFALPSPPVVNEKAKGSETKTLNPAEPAPKAAKKAPAAADIKVPSGKKPDSKKSVDKPQVARSQVAEPPSAPTNAIPGAATGQVALPYSMPAGNGGQATFGGDGSFGTRFSHYVSSMVRAITTQWENGPRPVARAGNPRVYVKFTIGRRGEISNVEIDQPSGVAQLDNAAKNAVSNASLPPLPPDYSGSSIDVRFFFEYTR